MNQPIKAENRIEKVIEMSFQQTLPKELTSEAALADIIRQSPMLRGRIRDVQLNYSYLIAQKMRTSISVEVVHGGGLGAFHMVPVKYPDGRIDLIKKPKSNIDLVKHVLTEILREQKLLDYTNQLS